MVTLADVARQAGVSSSTVSYVLSGKRSISESTRERVEQAIRQLGYHPNARARALASSRSNILALMVPLRTDMYAPILMEIAVAVTTAARGHGYDTLLLTGDEGPDAVRRIAASGLADAAILMDVELDDERIPPLKSTGLPAALIGIPADPAGLRCVDLDFTAAGAMCAEHLADLGHHELAVIGEAATVYRRRTGFAEATLAGLRRQAAERDLRLIHRPCEGTYESTAATLSRVFEERPDTTALIVQNEAALGPLLTQLRHDGRAVPEDVSVVAICPEQLAAQSSPRLTAVDIPAQAMGRRAVDLVMAQLAPEAEPEPHAAPLLLHPRLTLRDSSGPAPH